MILLQTIYIYIYVFTVRVRKITYLYVFKKYFFNNIINYMIYCCVRNKTHNYTHIVCLIR